MKRRPQPRRKPRQRSIAVSPSSRASEPPSAPESQPSLEEAPGATSQGAEAFLEKRAERIGDAAQARVSGIWGPWSKTGPSTYRNRAFGVVERILPGLARHFAVKPLDERPVAWREMQRIKDELAGPDATGIEIYPPRADVVDTAMVYHLWVLPPGTELGFSLSRWVEGLPVAFRGTAGRARATGRWGDWTSAGEADVGAWLRNDAFEVRRQLHPNGVTTLHAFPIDKLPVSPWERRRLAEQLCEPGATALEVSTPGLTHGPGGETTLYVLPAGHALGFAPVDDPSAPWRMVLALSAGNP